MGLAKYIILKIQKVLYYVLIVTSGENIKVGAITNPK